MFSELCLFSQFFCKGVGLHCKASYFFQRLNVGGFGFPSFLNKPVRLTVGDGKSLY